MIAIIASSFRGCGEARHHLIYACFGASSRRSRHPLPACALVGGSKTTVTLLLPQSGHISLTLAHARFVPQCLSLLYCMTIDRSLIAIRNHAFVLFFLTNLSASCTAKRNFSTHFLARAPGVRCRSIARVRIQNCRYFCSASTGDAVATNHAWQDEFRPVQPNSRPSCMALTASAAIRCERSTSEPRGRRQ
jgi:hypothetical protein